MTTLPVLHLKATSRHNVTTTADPYETTATLYTFLRSVPSVGEVDLAMQPFLAALHAAPSSGAAALMRRPNHRLLQRLEAVAVGEVFGRTPHVLPALARHNVRWKRRLGYAVEDEEADGGGDALDKAALSTSALGARQTPSHAALVGRVRAAELRQFADPYAAYEADYQAQHAASSEPRRSPAPAQAEASSVLAEVSALTAATTDASLHRAAPTQHHDADADLQCDAEEVAAVGEASGWSAMEAAAGDADLDTGVIHPVLDLIARQDGVLQPAPAVGESGHTVARGGAAPHGLAPASSTASPSSAPLSDADVEARTQRLTRRLADATAAVTAAMAEKEEAEEVWLPYYSRLKTAMLYAHELQGRVHCATSLFRLERYERETLQQAHIGIAMETMSLQLVLRDVRARIEDEARAPAAEGGDAAASLDAQLLQQLSAVLGLGRA